MVRFSLIRVRIGPVRSAMRSLFVWTAIVAALMLTSVLAPAASAATTGTVSVVGEVTSPATYTVADLDALPQTTYLVSRQGPGNPRTVTGVNLRDLVARSVPVLPAGKNTQLRVTLTVTGIGNRAVTFASGELDLSFGNHPAVLTTTGGRTVQLIVPADETPVRSVIQVTGVRVAVSTAGAKPVPPGAVQVTTGSRTVTLSAALLTLLPSRTTTVSFLAGGGPQTHTESGPPLSLALLAAGVVPAPNTSVVAVGSDGYGAAVTLGEDYFGGRPLLLSLVEDGTPLAQPRLVVDGDVRGGRYVTDVVVLQAG